MPISPGAHLGPYEVLAPLGAGGMGEVYRAKDTRLGRTVAIKVQIEGREADARTDMWALGCLLYEMVTGKKASRCS